MFAARVVHLKRAEFQDRVGLVGGRQRVPSQLATEPSQHFVDGRAVRACPFVQAGDALVAGVDGATGTSAVPCCVSHGSTTSCVRASGGSSRAEAIFVVCAHRRSGHARPSTESAET
jgi:hypothetical protein